MSETETQTALLLRCYGRFLDSGQSAVFVETVGCSYTLATLQKLLRRGNREVRRAAALALGILGDYECNTALGIGLWDPDRGVRLLSDHGLRQVWFRQGPPGMWASLQRLAWLNRCGKFDEAIGLANEVTEADPALAEAWNQRASAWAGLGDHAASIIDRRQALELNPFHFVAAAALASSYLQEDEIPMALEAFRQALRICPDLENVRAQIGKLERIVGG